MKLDVSPDQIFRGRLVFIAPHMDDEALACGGIIARLSQKERIHILYATDGTKSPAPVLPGVDAVSPDLGEARIKESIAAMKFLGVPEENLRFLRLPEGRLKSNLGVLRGSLLELIVAIRPDIIFIPFRYDRHPDHLAINHVIQEGQKQGKFPAQLMEYFVYHRWRLLPKKDIRLYIRPECLLEIDSQGIAKQKRKALDYFASQTTLYYPWQTRPILTARLLDEESSRPEYFLVNQPSLPGAAVFTGATLWIKLVHRVEPILKDWKYLAGAFLTRALRKYARAAG